MEQINQRFTELPKSNKQTKTEQKKKEKKKVAIPANLRHFHYTIT